MIQYADDLIYASRHMEEGGSTWDMIYGFGKSAVTWQMSMKSLSMLERGAKYGFAVPYTSVGRQYKAASKGMSLAKFGLKHGWWTQRGMTFAGPANPVARKMYEKAGLFGLGAAQTRAAGIVGGRVAGSSAAKYLVGRVAGIAMGAANILMWAPFLVEGTVGAYRAVSNQVTKYRGLELGGYFPETQGSYTSRQRMVQAITSSHLQARSAIGNEAMLFHRGS